jgi:hypothetical protein
MTTLTEVPKKDGLDAFVAEGNEWFRHNGKTGEWGIEASRATSATSAYAPTLKGRWPVR